MHISMKPIFFLILATPIALGSVAQAQQAATKTEKSTDAMPAHMQMDSMPMHQGPLSTTLKLTNGANSLILSPTELAALPHTSVTVLNGHTKTNQTYSGVLLSTLLARIGAPDKPHGKDLRLYLVAAGADGYKVVYSLAEVTPDLHDATVLVADQLDGKPLTDSGAFQLVATGEKRPARWVRNLQSIQLLSVE